MSEFREYTGKSLELDCYNVEYGVALEYNGIQHYKFPNPFQEYYFHYMGNQEHKISKKQHLI